MARTQEAIGHGRLQIGGPSSEKFRYNKVLELGESLMGRRGVGKRSELGELIGEGLGNRNWDPNEEE